MNGVGEQQELRPWLQHGTKAASHVGRAGTDGRRRGRALWLSTAGVTSARCGTLARGARCSTKVGRSYARQRCWGRCRPEEG